MNTFIGLTLYIAAYLVMIVVALLNLIPVDYLGGIVVALFIAGLFYAWLNAIRQTDNMIKTENRKQSAAKNEKQNVQERPPSYERATEPERSQKEEANEEKAIAA